MLILGRENWRRHRSWCAGVLAATAAASAWYLAYGFRSGAWGWPGGSSPPGFSFGVLGGGIILFEMLLWPRKSLWRGVRLGPTRYWMIAHIWLGLLTAPLLLLHGDFRLDPSAATLAAVLMWLLLLVVGSGVFGLAVQNVVPRLMLERLPAETITSQIGRVLGQYRDEADRMVRITCGEAESLDDAGDPMPAAESTRIVEVGRVQGKVVELAPEAGFVPGSEALGQFHRELVAPYLGAESGARHPLASSRRAASLFRGLEGRVPADALPVVRRLADLCDQRRQFDLQIRLHGWLYTWLAVHVALSVALVVLLIAHIVLALKYV